MNKKPVLVNTLMGAAAFCLTLGVVFFSKGDADSILNAALFSVAGSLSLTLALFYKAKE